MAPSPPLVLSGWLGLPTAWRAQGRHVAYVVADGFRVGVPANPAEVQLSFMIQPWKSHSLLIESVTVRGDGTRPLCHYGRKSVWSRNMVESLSGRCDLPC